MSKGINKIILVGRAGKEPEVRSLPAGGQVTTISLATSDSWKDKSTGQKVEHTEWHKVIFFNRLAEIAAQYLKKGAMVYVEGANKTRKWQDKNGEDRYSTEIVAKELQMLDSRGGEQKQGPVGELLGIATVAKQSPGQAGEDVYSASAPARKETSDTPVESLDDEIPF